MTDAIDAVVLDIDGGVMLEDCIASLRRQSLPLRRIVVFDNGSHVPVSARLAGVDVIRSETNLGFARGANQAYAATDAPLVALINNDVVLQEGWSATLAAAFAHDAQLGAAQSINRRPDGRIDGAGIDIGDGTFRQIGHGHRVGVPLAVAWGVSATAAIYRREAAGDRLFDERLFTYYEDVELSARLHSRGWRTAVVPLVLATHRGSSSASVLGRDALRLRTRNRYLVARAWPGVGSVPALIAEDFRLAFRGRTSLRGVIEGLTS